MFPDAVFVGREVHAVDLVLGDVTMQPLNLRPHVLQCLQRLQRHLADLWFRQRSSARDFAFDYELRHNSKSLTPNTGKIVIRRHEALTTSFERRLFDNRRRWCGSKAAGCFDPQGLGSAHRPAELVFFHLLAIRAA